MAKTLTAMTFVSLTQALSAMSYRSIFTLTATVLLFASCGGNGQDDSDKEQTQKHAPDTPSTSTQGTSSTAEEGDSRAKPPESPREDNLVLDLGQTRQAPEPTYRTLEGDTLNFRIRIPEGWRIAAAPPAGDGYQLATGSRNVDVRVYQESTKGKPGGLAPPDCQQKEPFQFRDQQGTKCIQATAVYYHITQRQRRLVFYVQAASEWRQRHQSQLDTIARSMAFDRNEPLSVRSPVQ